MAVLALSLYPAASAYLSSSRFRPNHRCLFEWRPPLVVTCSAPTGKARASRKVMSDDDLRVGLREFVSSVGFPQGHVPTTKELAEHGRKDLANIVRRRGHKFVKEVLANSIDVANGSTIECCLTEKENDTTGQDNKAKHLTEEAFASVEGVSSSVNRFERKAGSDVRLDDNSGVSIGSSNGSSLQEKVEKFLNYGSLDLDICEDNTGKNLWMNCADESREYKENSTGYSPEIHVQWNSRSVTGDRKDTLMLNGAAVMSKPDVIQQSMRNNETSLEAPAGDAFGQCMNHERREMENQDEVESLKHLLEQKELELSQLRELIEKEKETLSILQNKAEDEINRAQKLISEMDAEVLAAEDSLAGLKEVQIQYSGEGKVVEVAGSFNGWHQPIKMDPHPDDSKNPKESRNSRLWYKSLWLYPGEYEIKFIVDGEWKVDPKREITTRSGMQNNVIRVDG